jgi:UrcA family protein
MISSRVLASFIGAYVLAIVLIAPRVTYADSVDQPPAKAVRFGDLNLDTRSGAQTLFRRIQVAADNVCKQYEPQGASVPSAAHRTCVSNAVSAAVHSVDSPLLTAYYDEREDRQSQITAGGLVPR